MQDLMGASSSAAATPPAGSPIYSPVHTPDRSLVGRSNYDKALSPPAQASCSAQVGNDDEGEDEEALSPRTTTPVACAPQTASHPHRGWKCLGHS